MTVTTGLRPLSERELEVLWCAAAGLDVAATARRLTVTRATVKSHRARIIAALGAVNLTNAVARAVHAGLLT